MILIEMFKLKVLVKDLNTTPSLQEGIGLMDWRLSLGLNPKEGVRL
ncbi:MAG: hypothetical protein G5Z42_07550 [Caldisphaeraceae archaeon]|nr:hypothetical protein [Caldisphaeraceae archaeon]